MLRTVSVLPVASSERRRSETLERSISSSRRCLKLMRKSEEEEDRKPSLPKTVGRVSCSGEIHPAWGEIGRITPTYGLFAVQPF